MRNIRQDIRRFIIDNFLFGRDDVQIENSDSFVATGIVDPTGLAELILFLERHYQIKIEREEIAPENLDSIDKLVAFVEEKLGLYREGA